MMGESEIAVRSAFNRLLKQTHNEPMYRVAERAPMDKTEMSFGRSPGRWDSTFVSAQRLGLFAKTPPSMYPLWIGKYKGAAVDAMSA